MGWRSKGSYSRKGYSFEIGYAWLYGGSSGNRGGPAWPYARRSRNQAPQRSYSGPSQEEIKQQENLEKIKAYQDFATKKLQEIGIIASDLTGVPGAFANSSHNQGYAQANAFARRKVEFFANSPDPKGPSGNSPSGPANPVSAKLKTKADHVKSQSEAKYHSISQKQTYQAATKESTELRVRHGKGTASSIQTQAGHVSNSLHNAQSRNPRSLSPPPPRNPIFAQPQPLFTQTAGGFGQKPVFGSPAYIQQMHSQILECAKKNAQQDLKLDAIRYLAKLKITQTQNFNPQQWDSAYTASAQQDRNIHQTQINNEKNRIGNIEKRIQENKEQSIQQCKKLENNEQERTGHERKFQDLTHKMQSVVCEAKEAPEQAQKIQHQLNHTAEKIQQSYQELQRQQSSLSSELRQQHQQNEQNLSRYHALSNQGLSQSSEMQKLRTETQQLAHELNTSADKYRSSHSESELKKVETLAKQIENNSKKIAEVTGQYYKSTQTLSEVDRALKVGWEQRRVTLLNHINSVDYADSQHTEVLIQNQQQQENAQKTTEELERLDKQADQIASDAQTEHLHTQLSELKIATTGLILTELESNARQELNQAEHALNRLDDRIQNLEDNDREKFEFYMDLKKQEYEQGLINLAEELNQEATMARMKADFDVADFESNKLEFEYMCLQADRIQAQAQQLLKKDSFSSKMTEIDASIYKIKSSAGLLVDPDEISFEESMARIDAKIENIKALQKLATNSNAKTNSTGNSGPGKYSSNPIPPLDNLEPINLQPASTSNTTKTTSYDPTVVSETQPVAKPTPRVYQNKTDDPAYVARMEAGLPYPAAHQGSSANPSYGHDSGTLSGLAGSNKAVAHPDDVVSKEDFEHGQAVIDENKAYCGPAFKSVANQQDSIAVTKGNPGLVHAPDPVSRPQNDAEGNPPLETKKELLGEKKHVHEIADQDANSKAEIIGLTNMTQLDSYTSKLVKPFLEALERQSHITTGYGFEDIEKIDNKEMNTKFPTTAYFENRLGYKFKDEGLYKIEGEKFIRNKETTSICVISGMFNSPDEAKQKHQFVHSLFGGKHEVQGCYFNLQVPQLLTMLQDNNNSHIQFCRAWMKDILNENEKAIFITHSLGSLIFKNAVATLPDKEQDRISVISMGGADIIPKMNLGKVSNIICNLDPIPKLLNNNRIDILEKTYGLKTSEQVQKTLRQYAENLYYFEHQDDIIYSTPLFNNHKKQWIDNKTDELMEMHAQNIEDGMECSISQEGFAHSMLSKVYFEPLQVKCEAFIREDNS
ncbi:MAG: hypothetical protein K0S74_214 [Chlamydiales bacterium]|jgi:hypothetical protein|nr:hypothetical protein [Chlamydiales bacterium]